MAKDITRLRVLYLYQYLMKNTDSEHPACTADLIKMLKDTYGISTSRSTVSSDIETMAETGMPVEICRSKQMEYYYDGFMFERNEVRVLTDLIAMTSTLTERQSEKLKIKIISLISIFEADKIGESCYRDNCPRSGNEKFYYILDSVNKAVAGKSEIMFDYLADGGIVHVRMLPDKIIWDGSYYYVENDSKAEGMQQSYRLDKILNCPEIIKCEEKILKGNSELTQSMKGMTEYDECNGIGRELFEQVS